MFKSLNIELCGIPGSGKTPIFEAFSKFMPVSYGDSIEIPVDLNLNLNKDVLFFVNKLKKELCVKSGLTDEGVIQRLSSIYTPINGDPFVPPNMNFNLQKRTVIHIKGDPKISLVRMKSRKKGLPKRIKHFNDIQTLDWLKQYQKAIDYFLIESNFDVIEIDLLNE